MDKNTSFPDRPSSRLSRGRYLGRTTLAEERALPLRARHLPGIEEPAEPAPPEVGIPTSLFHRGRNSDFALPPRSEFRLRFFSRRSEFRLRSSTEVGIPTSVFCPKNPSPGQRRRSISDAVLVASLTECFFHHYSLCHQSCVGHRIALVNPVLGTELPSSILRWQQDCPFNPALATGLPRQSCAGNRIAPVSPRKLRKRPAI